MGGFICTHSSPFITGSETISDSSGLVQGLTESESLLDQSEVAAS
jgi:hypothetical protein